MNYIWVKPIFEVLLLILPVLFTVAYVTVAERKTMASMQRRVGPNAVGYYGLMQAFADALKLLLKEYIAPSQANIMLFFFGPILTLVFSLLAYAIVPYGPGITIFSFRYDILYLLAVSSLSTYGILLAGWAANSKYAFLGSLRSTAQLISYELILTSTILLVIVFTGNLNLIVTIEAQKSVWFLLPIFPVFLIFFMGSVAETNRAPFDLAEAESELVSGFMTEHSAVIFVFFFLAEYASIIFMCILISILFMGGYSYYINFGLDINEIIEYVRVVFIDDDISLTDKSDSYKTVHEENISSIILPSLYYSLALGLKTNMMVFVFIWVRASFPRIRYDQLMSYCWTVLLPLVVAYLIVVPCILFTFEYTSLEGCFV